MNLKLEQEFSKADIIQQVYELKNQIDAMRPLPPDVEGRVMQKLRLDWNYHSNAIEGNRLSYGETIAFLMEDITAKGKPLKDHLDIRGHNSAINFLLDIMKDPRPFTEADIRNLHTIILVERYQTKAKTEEGLPTTKWIELGEYKTSGNHVKTATGEIHYYATPQETPVKMQELMMWYRQASEQDDIHPLVLAALFHHKFVAIHPFDDGNGRMSRILMNLILMQKGYPPVVVKMDDRLNYYALLNRADRGDSWPFVEYIVENMIHSLQLYLNAAQGGNIDEDEDIAKEFALFKMQIGDKIKVKEAKNPDIIKRVIVNQIRPLSIKYFNTILSFSEFFLSHFYSVKLFSDPESSLKSTLMSELSDEHLTLIANDIQYLDHLKLMSVFYNFKNPSADFDMSYNLGIFFEEYYYKIIDYNGNLLLAKLYHESISAEEERSILKSVMIALQNFIKANMR